MSQDSIRLADANIAAVSLGVRFQSALTTKE